MSIVAPILFWSVILSVVVFSAWRAYHQPRTEADYACTNCRSRIIPRSGMRGSPVVEVLLWLCFFLPGLIYSLWRRSGPKLECPICSTPNPVPISTPVGRQIVGLNPQ